MKSDTPPANTKVHRRIHKSSSAPFDANKIHAEQISVKSTLIVLYLAFFDNLYLHFPYIHMLLLTVSPAGHFPLASHVSFLQR